MRFAFETVIWGRQLQDVELVLDTIAACGYAGVEFAQNPDEIFVLDATVPGGSRPVRDIEELLSLLNQRGLHLVGLAGGTLTRRIAFCGKDFRPEFLYVEDWTIDDEEARSALNAQPPFTLGIHPHWFMKVQRVAQVKDRLRRYREEYPKGKGVRFLPDTAHMTIVGDKPSEAVAELFNDLVAVHIKDWKPSYGRYSHRYAQGFVPLGRGVVHPEKVLQLLRERNFVGWVVVEQDFAYNSAAESTKACADWLIEKKWMEAPKAPRPSFDEAKQRETNSRRQELSAAATNREIKFLDTALPATIRGPARFYQTIVEAIHSLGGLDAVKLYSYIPHNDELYLLGVAGMPGHDCRKILEANSGLCRDVIRDQQIQPFDLSVPANAIRFDDDEFLHRLKGKRMVTVPIFNPSNPHHLRFLLNLFPSEADFWGSRPDGRTELTRLAAHLSRLADYVADDVCSAAALETSYECGHSTSKNEFLIKLVRLVQRLFDCEGVSIFLVNETGDRLELPDGATTGVEWDPNLKLHEHYYPYKTGITGTVWAKGEMLLLSDSNKHPDLKRRSWEKRDSVDRDECLLAPLARLGGKVVGVIRLTNKKRPLGSRAATMFTDDDAAVLDSIAQAALPYLELLTFQERQLSAVTRMVHEFQVPMVAIRAAVDFMQHILTDKGQTAKDLFGEDYLNDVLDWSGLMGRLANNARVFAARPSSLALRVSRTKLKSEVVAPAVHQVGALLRERAFESNCIYFGDFADIPPLWIDRHQFQQVVFNLLSNSIKYAERGRLKVRIDAGQHGNAYLIWFQDWGPGIENGTEELIFQPGYRSRDAMRKDVTGQGVGLLVVRTIVEAHGGKIRLTSTSQPTKFEISLPSSLRQSPPSKQNEKESLHGDNYTH